jgi:hypothetical protein
MQMAKKSNYQEEDNINLSDAIDEMIARERMHFEENLIMMLKDMGREVKAELNFVRKKVDRIEKKLAGKLSKKTGNRKA